jgi:hypothetical protein
MRDMTNELLVIFWSIRDERSGDNQTRGKIIAIFRIRGSRENTLQHEKRTIFLCVSDSSVTKASREWG